MWFRPVAERVLRARLAFALWIAGGAACAPPAPPSSVVPVAFESPAAAGSIAPNWASVASQPALTWWEPAGAPDNPGPPWRMRFARWSGAGWSAPVTITEGHDYFANWADFPSVAAGADQALYAHWLEKTAAGTYAYGVQLARSTDGGATWSPLGLLHRDGTDTEHGFVTLIPEGRGVRAVWLDGRDTATGGAMTLRSALVDEAVRTDTEELLDARICDCCSSAAIATPDGPLVAFRDRDPDEIRDISLVRRTATGWSAPAPVYPDGWADGWKIPGCPVNGPALASHGDTVWAAWFTAAGERPRVLAAVSSNRGRSFGAPIEVDAAAPQGRVGLASLPDGAAVLSWLGAEGEAGVIRLALLDAQGTLGQPREIARTAVSRGTGVPRIVVHEGEVWVTWVSPGDKEQGELSRVELRRIDL